VKTKFLILFLWCQFFGAAVCWGQDLDKDMILKHLAVQVPENHKMVYAGRYYTDGAEKFYLFYQPAESNACANLALKLGRLGLPLKEIDVRFVVCYGSMSTIAKTAIGTFYFPSAWQRKTGTKAALDGKIFLQELKFPDEEEK